MFMRYLGGGIGHLGQFPPANNDNGVTCEYEEDNDDEIGRTGDTDKDGCGHNDEEDEDDNRGDNDDDDDSEAAEGDEDPDPGESSDEEMGNVY